MAAEFDPSQLAEAIALSMRMPPQRQDDAMLALEVRVIDLQTMVEAQAAQIRALQARDLARPLAVLRAQFGELQVEAAMLRTQLEARQAAEAALQIQLVEQQAAEAALQIQLVEQQEVATRLQNQLLAQQVPDADLHAHIRDLQELLRVVGLDHVIGPVYDLAVDDAVAVRAVADADDDAVRDIEDEQFRAAALASAEAYRPPGYALDAQNRLVCPCCMLRRHYSIEQADHDVECFACGDHLGRLNERMLRIECNAGTCREQVLCMTCAQNLLER